MSEPHSDDSTDDDQLDSPAPVAESNLPEQIHRQFDRIPDDHPLVITADDDEDFQSTVPIELQRQLSDSLYTQSDVWMREWIQNHETAVYREACRVVRNHEDEDALYRVVEHDHDALEGPREVRIPRPMAEVFDCARQYGYEPTIEIEVYHAANKIVTRDNGVGLTTGETLDVWNEPSQSGARLDSQSGGKFGVGSLSFVTIVDTDGAMLVETRTRRDETVHGEPVPARDKRGYNFYAYLGGVQPIPGGPTDGFYGTQFTLVCQSSVNTGDVRDWVRKYEQEVRAPIIYTEHRDGSIVFDEEYGRNDFVANRNGGALAIEHPSEYTVVLGDRDEHNMARQYRADPSDTYLVSMPISRSEGDLECHHNDAIQLHDEQGRIVAGPNRGRYTDGETVYATASHTEAVGELHAADVPLPQPTMSRDDLQDDDALARFHSHVVKEAQASERAMLVDITTTLLDQTRPLENILNTDIDSETWSLWSNLLYHYTDFNSNGGVHTLQRALSGLDGVDYTWALDRLPDIDSDTTYAEDVPWTVMTQPPDDDRDIAWVTDITDAAKAKGVRFTYYDNTDEDPAEDSSFRVTHRLKKHLEVDGDERIEAVHGLFTRVDTVRPSRSPSHQTQKKRRDTYPIIDLLTESDGPVFMAASTGGRFTDRLRVVRQTYSDPRCITVKAAQYEKYERLYGFRRLTDVPYTPEANDGEWDLPDGLIEQAESASDDHPGVEGRGAVMQLRTQSGQRADMELGLWKLTQALADAETEDTTTIPPFGIAYLVCFRPSRGWRISDHYDLPGHTGRTGSVATVKVNEREWDALKRFDRAVEPIEYLRWSQNATFWEFEPALSGHAVETTARDLIRQAEPTIAFRLGVSPEHLGSLLCRTPHPRLDIQPGERYYDRYWGRVMDYIADGCFGASWPDVRWVGYTDESMYRANFAFVHAYRNGVDNPDHHRAEKYRASTFDYDTITAVTVGRRTDAKAMLFDKYRLGGIPSSLAFKARTPRWDDDSAVYRRIDTDGLNHNLWLGLHDMGIDPIEMQARYESAGVDEPAVNEAFRALVASADERILHYHLSECEPRFGGDGVDD